MARKNQPSQRHATPPGPTGRPDQSRMRRVAKAQENAISKGSQTVYYKHWKAFADWSFDNEYRALPAHVDTICLYLTERADTGIKVATLGPILAAIRHYHESVELTSPTTNPQVKKTLKGLGREYPRPPAQATPLDQEAFDTIFEKAYVPKGSETPHQTVERAAFDLALISFSRDILARPENAAAAEWHHIEDTPDGDHVLFIPHSKTDQTHEGRYAYLTQLTMQLLDEMVATRKRKPKPTDRIFGVSERQISNRVKAAAEHAGLVGRYRGQSSRVGMAIDLALDGFDLPALKQAGRWTTDKTVSRYIAPITAIRNAVARRDAGIGDDDHDDAHLAA